MNQSLEAIVFILKEKMRLEENLGTEKLLRSLKARGRGAGLGSETPSLGVGGPPGSRAYQTLMPPTFELRTQDGEEEGVWPPQMPQKGFPKVPAVVMPGSLHRIYWVEASISGLLSKALQTHTPYHQNRQGQQPAHGWGEGTMLQGQTPQGQDKGSREPAGIQGTASSSRCVYTRFSCVDHATDFPLEVDNWEGLNTFLTTQGLRGPVEPESATPASYRVPGPGD